MIDPTPEPVGRGGGAFLYAAAQSAYVLASFMRASTTSRTPSRQSTRQGPVAALYMSSHVIYSVQEDPWHAKRETDPIGAAKPGYSATSVVSKIAGEAVARYCAREYDLPVVIARLNAPYGHLAACR